MLHVGLTGGIGSGKSSVAKRMVARGALLIDSDVLAREVVAPGTEGLAEIVATFGTQILDQAGSLDRAAIAARVFDDAAARSRLESIIHPRVRERSAERVAAASADAIIVHDIPLLAEVGLAPSFDLVVVVTAPTKSRLTRLADRGMPSGTAKARIDAQAPEEVRNAVADEIIDNSADLDALTAAVDRLWERRIVPFAANKLHRRIARAPEQVKLYEYDPRWPRRFQRLAARLDWLLGDAAERIDHIGSTAVAGLIAKNVIDVQISVRDLAVADDFAPVLTEAGFPRHDGIRFDTPHPAGADPARWEKRLHGGVDPANIAHIHIRVTGSPGWRYALAFRDYLRSHPAERDSYANMKAGLVERNASMAEYVAAKEPWFEPLWSRIDAWAAETEWPAPADQ